MDALKQQLLRIQQQLQTLSASQKMLTVAMVAIMVMTLAWWGSYAGSADLQPLLDQALSGEELASMKSALSAGGISYSVVGDRIMVPADKRIEAVAQLGLTQALPRDMHNAFDDMVAKLNPLQAPTTTDKLMNHAKEMMLAQMFSRWPGVSNAIVMIDNTNIRRIGGSIEPSAAVALTMKPGTPRNLAYAEAAADMVAGAQAGVDRAKVKITIDGQPIPVRSDDMRSVALSGDFLESRANAERQYREKIEQFLGNYGMVYVTVSVGLVTETTLEKQRLVDPKNKIELNTRTLTESSEGSESTFSGADPGVVSNTASANGAMSVAAGGGPASTTTHEKNETTNEVDHGYTTRDVSRPAGDAPAVTAAVSVPESFFINLWKSRNPAGAVGPSPAEVQSLVDAEIPNIRNGVRAATAIADDNAISVATYHDVAPPPVTEVATAGLANGIGGWGMKEIAIGVLAAVSLFMVSMMVRRGTPKPIILPAPQMKPEANKPSVMMGEDVAGEVGGGSGALMARELSPEAIESSQIVEQVATMVKENPDAAASMVRRWLSQD